MSQHNAKGRPKLTKVQSANREYARKVIKLREAENDFMREVGAEFRESVYEKQQLAKNAEKRVKLWALIDGVTARVNEARKSGNSAEEKALKADRAKLYEALNDIPPLGYTYSEGAAEREGEGAKMGRPPLGPDAIYSRAKREAAKAEEALRQAEEATGEKASPLNEVIDQVSRDGAGRPKNLRVDDLKNTIDALDAEIRFIMSGEAQKQREERIAARMAREGVTDPDRLSGRRFKPLSIILNERMAKRAKAEADYLRAVARLDDKQAAKHQVRTVSRQVKRAARMADNDEWQPGAWGVAQVRDAHLQAMAPKPYKPLPAKKRRNPGRPLMVRTAVDTTDLDEVGKSVERLLNSLRKKG